jgi:4-hydroxybenzoate polyprenyltransferase
MHRSRPRHGVAYAGLVSALWSHAAMAATAAAGAVSLILLASWAPQGLVLPILSVTLLAAAGLLALIAWRIDSNRNSENVTVWDVCGACGFVGFAAAILSQPENVLTAFAPVTGG